MRHERSPALPSPNVLSSGRLGRWVRSHRDRRGTAVSQPPNLETEQRQEEQSVWPVEGVEGSAGHPWVSVQERRDRLWIQRN